MISYVFQEKLFKLIISLFMVSFQDISKIFMLVAKQFIDNTMDGTSQVFVGLTVIMLVER